MKRTGVYLLIVLLLSFCRTPEKVGYTSKQSPYKTTAQSINPEFVVFHVSDALSELHFKISSRDLLYTRADGVNLSSKVLISYRMINYITKDLTDSSSFRLLDVNNDNLDKFLIGKINFFAKKPNNYLLKITVTDLNRNESVEKSVFVQKDNEINRQNFLVKSAETDVPVFRNYVKSGEKIVIDYTIRIPAKVYVRYYNRDFPLAAPPFSESPYVPFKYKEDSLFVLTMTPQGNINFTSNKQGFYHIQYDSTSREGLTLFDFSGSFPEVKTTTEMLPPLRYITTKAEYEELNAIQNKKMALDKFWLSNNGNHDKARDLIKKYYNRVAYANKYFTSYIEGWKTDRGMIFLIYGTPSVVYRSENSETWIYGEEKSVNAINYSFVKVKNPFSDNDFTLDRSSFYRQSWYIAVDAWRQGRAFAQE